MLIAVSASNNLDLVYYVFLLFSLILSVFLTEVSGVIYVEPFSISFILMGCILVLSNSFPGRTIKADASFRPRSIESQHGLSD